MNKKTRSKEKWDYASLEWIHRARADIYRTEKETAADRDRSPAFDERGSVCTPPETKNDPCRRATQTPSPNRIAGLSEIS